jgi:putative transposase
MAIDKELLDQLLPNYKNPEDLIGENGLLRQLTKALMERALEAEMATRLGYEKSDPVEKPDANRPIEKAKRPGRVISASWRSPLPAIGKQPSNPA